jgi:twitching motility protein PilT
VLAAEVMLPNAAIRTLIREGRVHQLHSQMQVGQAASGMQTMSQALIGLVRRDVVTLEEAAGHAPEPAELRHVLERARGSHVG